MKKGFSLVELLVAMIVIACITAAFVPLITKKFSSGAFGGSINLTTNCSEKFGENCKLCTDTYCIKCVNLTCPDGEYKDTKSCSCKKCSDTYGPDCEKCTEKKCLTCPDGQFLDENNDCKPCSDRFENCSSCTIDKCSACDNGYALTNPNSSKPCSKFDCSGPDFIQIGNLCITKKNMGDGDSLTIPNGVTVVNVGTSCSPSSSNFCCWKGNTSGTSCDNANGGGYSGCNRTVCDWNAADYICKNFSAGGYTWRLATTDEMSSWANNSIGKGVNGLQLCDGTGYSSARCYSTFTCRGISGNGCFPYLLWSGTARNTSSFYNYNLFNGSWVQYDDTYKNAFSTRCVAQMPQSCADKFNEGCTICEGSQCLECSSGYVLKNGKCELDCSKFGSNCSSCTASKCTACADGYKLSSNPSGNPACVSDFSCDGDDFIQIGNLCITKKNMGDGDKLTIPSGVKMTNAYANCSSGNLCCWTGSTAKKCDNKNGGGYSGCNRTACNWNAADYICKNFNAGGYTWRLATRDEMSNWANNSINLGVNGLQLCDDISGRSSAYCESGDACNGSQYGYCDINYIWSTDSSVANAYLYMLSGGSWSKANYSRAAAFSTRCVAQMPQSCSDKHGAGCATCTDSKCLSCESGYNLSSNASSSNACEKPFTCSGTDFMQIGSLCVTRRNMGDSTALTIPSGVNVVNSGSTCNASSSNKCCWKGTTASPCDNENGGGYSGCNRTVCDWWAADYICKNFKAGGYTWHLATTDEMTAWADYSRYEGVNGLQLCEGTDNYGEAALCENSAKCPGAIDKSCSPHMVWSSRFNDSTDAYAYGLYLGGWGMTNYERTSAYSVRCVTNL